MRQDNIIEAPYDIQAQALTQVSGEKVGDAFLLQQRKSWWGSGYFQISEEDIKRCIRENAKAIWANQIISFDLILTSFGFIISTFLLIFSTITSNGFLILISIFIVIPTIVHTVDGVTRRWKRNNLIKKIN